MKIRNLVNKTGSVLFNAALLMLGFTFAQCSQSDDMVNDEQKVSPSIYAQFGAMQDPTRTDITSNGKVSWTADDDLKVFVSPAGESSYGAYKYVTTAADCAKNKFNAEQNIQLTVGQSYDWYIMSPYSDDVTDPYGGTESTTEFSFDKQTQDCTRPTAHLTDYDIMTGVVKNLRAEENISVNMTHKGALMKFTLVNNLGEEATVRNIEFVAAEGTNIGGTYSIDFSHDGGLTPKNARNTSVLRLIHSKVAAGASLNAYIMMPAFTIKAGTEFTIRVYTDKGMVEQTMKPSKNIVFKAGSINSSKISLENIMPVFFANGVTKTSGWYDVNKKEDGRSDFGDAVLCWGAACSNMIEWWQDRYKEVNPSLPRKAVTGPGKDYELAIFEKYLHDWDNSHGGQVYFGIPWYFTGEDRAAEIGMQGNAVPKKGTGGYYKKEWQKIETLLGAGKKYVDYFEAYSTWIAPDDVSVNADKILTDLIVNAISKGTASLSVRAGYSNQHAITLWGYELTNGIVSKLYVTDSDDMLNQPKAPRVQLMQEYVVKEKAEREVYMLNTYAGDLEITQIVPFIGYPVD